MRYLCWKGHNYLFPQNANETASIKSKIIEDQTDSIKKLRQVSSRGFHYGVADLLVNETSCSVLNSFCLCTIICERFHYCASNHLYLILNRSGSVCASLSLGCSTTPQSYRVPMNDISRGDVFNNFSLKSRWIGFLLISTTLVIYIRRRKVNLIDVYGGHFLFCLDRTLFTPFHSFLLCQYCNFKAQCKCN